MKWIDGKPTHTGHFWVKDWTGRGYIIEVFSEKDNRLYFTIELFGGKCHLDQVKYIKKHCFIEVPSDA